jgi:8-oxo-dGTP diphosphatase
MTVNELYGNKIRVRACGLLIQNQKYLLVNHAGLNPENIFWHFPGGGVNPAESITQALKRELMEETGLVVEVQEFINWHEHFNSPLQAVELFFRVNILGGKLELGQDPELPIIKDLGFFSKEEILQIPKNQVASSIFDLI